MESLQETEKSLHPTRFKGREAMRISYSHEKERINVPIRRAPLTLPTAERANKRQALPPVAWPGELLRTPPRQQAEGNRTANAAHTPRLGRARLRQLQHQKLQQPRGNHASSSPLQKDFVDNRFEKR